MRRPIPRIHRVAVTLLIATAAISTRVANAQDSTRVRPAISGHYWRNFAAGFATSILSHEAAHVGTAVALGAHPWLGFDKARPTVYSGLDATAEPHKQFLFSSAGLDAQALLDETILDVPHHRGAAFERGVLAGGIGTALFYVTIGRWGRVSDIDFIARTHALNKTQATLIYGGVAALHTWRVSRDGRYANFFARPDSRGRVAVGVDLNTDPRR